VSVRYCGREFTDIELDVLRHLCATMPTRRAIADAACDQLGWLRIDGRRKDMSARVALLRMERDGLLTLPAPRTTNGNGRITRWVEPAPELALAMPGSLDELGPIELALVDTKAAKARWRMLVSMYHYLGYNPVAGAQLRYLVESRSGTVAALGFAASAWKCAPRDAHIGWDASTREARLHLVVGNSRFLILPNVRVANLASTILSRVARRLPSDFCDAYGYEPVLVETFVETGRFTGASYKAANWKCVGQTKGRGKLDRYNERALPVKDVYLYPLTRNYLQVLTAPV
jgi:hypothetical protein